MTRVRSFAIAFGLAVGTVSSIAVLTPTMVAAADSKPKVSRAVGEPLKKAQEAMTAKQLDTAMTEIKKAQAVEKKTPFEEYQIDEFLGYILIQQKKYGEAAAVYERMLNSGQMPPEQVNDRTKAVAQMYFQVKEYKKSADAAKKWLDKNPNNEDMQVLLGQAYYLLNDYPNAATVMSSVVANNERTGQTPKENYLQLILNSQAKQDDKQAAASTLKKLVRYYPKADYWKMLLDQYNRRDASDRHNLGFYRLKLETGTLSRSSDFVEMAQLAIDAGVPGEAQKIVEQGMESGALKSGDKNEQGRYDRLLASAKKQADADRASLPQLAKEAEKAAQGQADIALGQAYLSYGQLDEAIAVLQRGLKKGTVTDADEAQLSLGLAYLKKGQKDQARQAFKAIKGDSKWADLAELWSIRSQSA
jgi:tetratricopeptide (TPR) repeat protein